MPCTIERRHWLDFQSLEQHFLSKHALALSWMYKQLEHSECESQREKNSPPQDVLPGGPYSRYSEHPSLLWVSGNQGSQAMLFQCWISLRVPTHRNPWSSRNFKTTGLIFGPLALWSPQPVMTSTVGDTFAINQKKKKRKEKKTKSWASFMSL